MYMFETIYEKILYEINIISKGCDSMNYLSYIMTQRSGAEHLCSMTQIKADKYKARNTQ